MKLLSLVATLSYTGLLAVCSLGASAEMLLDGQNKTDMKAAANKSAIYKGDRYRQQQNLARHNPHNKEKNTRYSVFSFAQGKQVTLSNIGQNLALEDVEWYIEKY